MNSKNIRKSPEIIRFYNKNCNNIVIIKFRYYDYINLFNAINASLL